MGAAMGIGRAVADALLAEGSVVVGLDIDATTIEDARRDAGKLAPLGRAGSAAEVASLVALLLSDSASYISGAAIPVDGEATARATPS
jgi:NAD(P)-dependent dehydrogenase (short-subunit alcohol dehydrogenase family)